MRVPRRNPLVLVGVANACIAEVLYLSLLVVLPARAADVSGALGKNVAFAAVAGTGALVALIAGVVAGMVSDRLAVGVGTRRAVLGAGLLFTTVALIAVPVANSTATLALAWCAAQVGLNALLTAATCAR